MRLKTDIVRRIDPVPAAVPGRGQAAKKDEKEYFAISKIVVISVNSHRAFFSNLASLAALYLFLCNPIS
jgi:hypothetical protein